MSAQWPFTYIGDSSHRSIGWAVINAPIVSPSRREWFAELRRRGFRFIGMASDGAFPAGTGSDALDYAAICEAWCHCFRDPDRYLPADVPRALISNSDFTDARRIDAELAAMAVLPAAADLLYVGATEPWKQEAKSWELAKRVLPRIEGELGVRALVVGGTAMPESPSVRCVQPLPWREFLGTLAGARALFVPNVLDASPRILTEALALNVPVVVNRAILGGWKYVNAFTGMFFNDESDVVECICSCLRSERQPRRWYEAHFGPYHSGRRLLALLRGLDPSIEESSHLVLMTTAGEP